MKVAVLTESSADDEAVRVPAKSVLGEDTSFPEPRIVARGYEAVLGNLSSIYKWLHFRREAEALLVVVDSDQSPIEESHPRNRMTLLLEQLTQLESEVTPIEGFPPIKTAVGVAAPSIESWLLFGQDPQCTEASWSVSLEAGKGSHAEIQRLKKLLYGTTRPSLSMEKEVMTETIETLIAKDKLAALEDSFPWGFKPLVTALRAWQVNP